MKSKTFFGILFLMCVSLPALADHWESLACQWNGGNYQPYDMARRQWIGNLGYGFVRIDRCNEAIFAAHEGLVCNWNGNNYQPYEIWRNIPMGKVGYGFAALENCNKTVQYSSQGLLCQWNGAKMAMVFQL
ncbi:MAG: hypothetical protein HYW85_03765 [Deltaproteobacteria bacterium]|nr:hypothetical protein [Deltaproteobacteria bacterium]